MKRALVLLLICCAAGRALAQSGEPPPAQEQRERERNVQAKQQEKEAQHADVIDFRGNRAFDEKRLRSELKEQITTINQYGITTARADDAAFFLALFYRKQGYAKVDVRYSIERGNRILLTVEEGPLVTLGQINFVGNQHEPAEKLFDFAVGPTRERYSKTQKQLPFVAADVQEGADLVHRLYVAEGFVNATVESPIYHYGGDGTHVDVTLPITEGRQYMFGTISFSGDTIYGPETLRGQMLDVVDAPYTDTRLADIPRRLQTYFKARGYYDVKVEANGSVETAENGRVPVHVSVRPGPLYHFDGVQITGLRRLRPSVVERRFSKFHGQVYSPEVVEERFRELMRTGLFTQLQIKPTPVDGNLLRLDISAEEAKSKEVGFSLGYGSYVGPIVGASFRDRDLFGYGRPLTTSVEWTGRGYKGEILWDDPWFLDTDNELKARLSALTFDFDGYSKFEYGGRIDLSRKFSKFYQAGVVISYREVKLQNIDIEQQFVGPHKYTIGSVGLTHTLDLRDNKVLPSRGWIFDNTIDLSANAIGSDFDFIRSTARVTYLLPFAPPVSGATEVTTSGQQAPLSWFQRSSLAFGARVGIIHSLDGETSQSSIPIDERFFSGGATTVRSFGERDLGPHDRHGYPVGGEFFTVWNVEYTFPLYGELQGAVFFDAGNLLPSSEDPFNGFSASLDDMRYAIGAGLRYKLPVGPIRLDYGVNPDRRKDEDFGAFHFSFGFAF
ncbi:MAG: outer membrane protein assembly factor [Chthoniobacterales bacterium]